MLQYMRKRLRGVFRKPPSKQRNDKGALKIFPDDVFLVSYPKSGNTWVRFLFANVLKRNPSELITFQNVHDYCPEWGLQEDLILQLPSPRILKSHEQFNVLFPKVIYIVRDPRDVYVSYYHYLKKQVSEEWSLTDFIQDFKYPLGRWSEHVESWIANRANQPEHFRIVRYEDLMTRPLQIFSELVRFAGLTVSECVLQEAVQNSSFGAMRNIERQYGRKYDDGAENFVRSGQTGQWKTAFGDIERKAFSRKEKNYAKWLEYLGYSK